jgi:hypothetical protein
MSSRRLNCCCSGTLAQVKAAFTAPPDAPARRTLLLMMPSCLKMAALINTGRQDRFESR